MHMAMLAVVLLFFSGTFAVVQKLKGDVRRTVAGDASCKGQLIVRQTAHNIVRGDHCSCGDHGPRLFVRLQLENESEGEISDPVIRVEARDVAGSLVDVFKGSAYGENLEAGDTGWIRVSHRLVVEPDKVASVVASVASADCRSAWR